MESRLSVLKELNKNLESAYALSKYLIDSDKIAAENYLFGLNDINKTEFDRVRVLRDMLAKLGVLSSVAGDMLDDEVARQYE